MINCLGPVEKDQAKTTIYFVILTIRQLTDGPVEFVYAQQPDIQDNIFRQHVSMRRSPRTSLYTSTNSCLLKALISVIDVAVIPLFQCQSFSCWWSVSRAVV